MLIDTAINLKFEVINFGFFTRNRRKIEKEEKKKAKNKWETHAFYIKYLKLLTSLNNYSTRLTFLTILPPTRFDGNSNSNSTSPKK